MLSIMYIMLFMVVLFAQTSSGKVLSNNRRSRMSYVDDGNDCIDDQQNSAKIQYMITNRMRRVLEDELGYLSEEVDSIEPQIASVVIERGLVRPSNGMPASWRRSDNNNTKFPSSNIISRLSRSIFRVASKTIDSFKSAATKFLPAAIPLILGMYLIPLVTESLSIYRDQQSPNYIKSILKDRKTLNKAEDSKSNEPIKTTVHNSKLENDDLNEREIDVYRYNEINQKSPSVDMSLMEGIAKR